MINDYEATEPIISSANPTTSTDTMSNDDVISTLNDLIETARDGQEGFREAAGAIKSSDVRTFLLEASQQRAQFVGELQGLIRDLGGDAENEGTIAGAVHRGWMDLKAAIAGNDEHSVLVECERGEDHAKKAYKTALEENLPANIRSTVQTQSDLVIETHNRVKAFRDATGNTNTASTATGSGTGGF
jgi:uncharacterized protein (TIGR02284 family)